MDDSRLMLTDEAWDRLAAIIDEVKSRAGAPPKLSDRDFVEAVLYLARTGCPWRDLPERFGEWDAVYQRFRRWEEAGVWRALFERLPGDLAGVETILLDSSVIRAHPHAAGAPKKKAARRRRPSAVAAADSGRRSTWPPPTRRRPWPWS
jgi:transposase